MYIIYMQSFANQYNIFIHSVFIAATIREVEVGFRSKASRNCKELSHVCIRSIL